VNTYTTEIDVRFRDIDAMGHVNNAVYATYIEQARTEYFRDVLRRRHLRAGDGVGVALDRLPTPGRAD